MRLSSIAQINTPPKLWPTRCTVSPGTPSMKFGERGRVRSQRALRPTDK